MKTSLTIKTMFACVVLATALACQSAPVTGRRQLALVPSDEINDMSAKQYQQFLAENKLSDDKAQTELVQKVGKRIQEAVESYFKEKGESDKLKGYNWEFNLVDSKEVNAWCMPGGKVVVYTAILPITQDENGLAVVLGHEIAHAVANHGNERMSQELIVNYSGQALSALTASEPEATQQLMMGAYGAGTKVGVILPFSRTHETEADHLGLIFMAKAGYDPQGAVAFWTRMSKMAGAESKPPQFMSTHPSDATRIENIKKFMPEAMKYYKKP